MRHARPGFENPYAPAGTAAGGFGRISTRHPGAACKFQRPVRLWVQRPLMFRDVRDQLQSETQTGPAAMSTDRAETPATGFLALRCCRSSSRYCAQRRRFPPRRGRTGIGFVHRRFVKRREVPKIVDIQARGVAVELSGGRVPLHIRHRGVATAAIGIIKPARDRIGIKSVKLVQ